MLTAYHLFFDSPVHFGIESIGQEKTEITVRSDTLWGALVQKWLLLFDEEPDILCTNSGFNVSSCFPFVNGNRFYPLPIGSLDNLMNEVAHGNSDDLYDIKTLKKIRFISEALLEKIINGKQIELKNISDKTVYPFRVKKTDEADVLCSQEQRPRLRIDQLNQGAGDEAFFYCTDQFFSKFSGLFFLANFEDEQVQRKFEAALRLLGDSGIGADRSVGRGFFRFDKKKIDLRQESSTAQEYLLLSLLRPSRSDIADGLLIHGRYSLVRRFGRAASSATARFRRADCWMLEEGSVLPFKPVGTIPKVLKTEDDKQIPHNVYRYAKGLCLPLSARG